MPLPSASCATRPSAAAAKEESSPRLNWSTPSSASADSVQVVQSRCCPRDGRPDQRSGGRAVDTGIRHDWLRKSLASWLHSRLPARQGARESLLPCGACSKKQARPGGAAVSLPSSAACTQATTSSTPAKCRCITLESAKVESEGHLHYSKKRVLFAGERIWRMARRGCAKKAPTRLRWVRDSPWAQESSSGYSTSVCRTCCRACSICRRCGASLR